MRQRINRNAVCSSCNYIASRRAHLAMLKEHHASKCFLALTGEVDPDFNRVKPNRTIMVFGKPMEVTYAEYMKYNLKNLGF